MPGVRYGLFVVGIAVAACKDKQAAAPAEKPVPGAETPAGERQRTPGVPAPAETGAAPQAAPAPSLDVAFDAETEDAAWASATEQAIAAVAPDLGDVTCKRMQCRVTVSAATETELAAKLDQLQSEESLRGLDGAQNVLLTAPAASGGTTTMKVYVRFER
jgi:hypothetical protein